MTVLECKNYATPVPVNHVEAFITKADDVGANRKVMASSSGFQSGAQQVAAKHDVTLIQVTESAEVDPSVFGATFAGATDALNIRVVELEYEDGERKALPEYVSAMEYYIKSTILRNATDTRSLDSIIEELSTCLDRGAVNETRDNVVTCPPNTRVIAPDDGEIPLKKVLRLHVKTALTRAKMLSSPYLFDLGILVPDVKVKDVGTGEERTFTAHELALGFDTVFEEGTFYEQPQFGYYYYCDRIDGRVATIYLVESFQLGCLFQAEFRQETQYSKYYVRVTDKSTIERLARRLKEIKSK